MYLFVVICIVLVPYKTLRAKLHAQRRIHSYMVMYGKSKKGWCVGAQCAPRAEEASVRPMARQRFWKKRRWYQSFLFFFFLLAHIPSLLMHSGPYFSADKTYHFTMVVSIKGWNKSSNRMGSFVNHTSSIIHFCNIFFSTKPLWSGCFGSNFPMRRRLSHHESAK